jgi:hypothetical protein
MYLRYIGLWVVTFDVLPGIALFAEYSAAIVVCKATDALYHAIVFFWGGIERWSDTV